MYLLRHSNYSNVREGVEALLYLYFGFALRSKIFVSSVADQKVGAGFLA